MYLLSQVTARIWPDPIDPEPPAAPPTEWPDPDQPGALTPVAAAAEAPGRRRCVWGPTAAARLAPSAGAGLAPMPADPPRLPVGLGRRKAQWLPTGLLVAAAASLIHTLTRNAGIATSPVPWAGPVEMPKPFGGHAAGSGNASDAMRCEASDAPPHATPEAPPGVHGSQKDAGLPSAAEMNASPDLAVAEPTLLGPTLWTSLLPEGAHAQRETEASEHAGAPAAGSAGKAASRQSGQIRALTQAIEAILADEAMPREARSILALAELARKDAGASSSAEPAATLSRMVTAFRSSRFSRQYMEMQLFIWSMDQFVEKNWCGDGRFDHLLRLWTWRWGDCAHEPGKITPKDARVPPHALTMVVTAMLGESLPAEYLLQRFIAAITRAPDGMPKSDVLGDQTTLHHADWVAFALKKVLAAKAFRTTSPDNSQTGKVDFGQAYRILSMFMNTPAADGRWKPSILRMLEAEPLKDEASQPLMTKDEWEMLLLLVVQSHLAETRPQLARPGSMDAAITALVNPARYRQGKTDAFKVTVDRD